MPLNDLVPLDLVVHPDDAPLEPMSAAEQALIVVPEVELAKPRGRGRPPKSASSGSHPTSTLSQPGSRVKTRSLSSLPHS